MMADKPNKPDKNKPNKLERRARRDVNISQRPQVNQLHRAQKGTENVYQGLDALLAPMPDAYQTQATGISDQLAQNLGDFSSLLNSMGALPVSEVQGAGGVYGGLGASGLNTLASQQQRGLDYITSAQRESGLAGTAAQDNLTQQLNTLYSQQPQMIRQREDELRQQRITNQLAQSQIAGDAATNAYLQSLIGGYVNPNPNPNSPPYTPPPNSPPPNNPPRNPPRNPPTDTNVGGNSPNSLSLLPSWVYRQNRNG